MDDYIDAWHEGKVGLNMELHEFLGMSAAEYALWVERPEVLPFIVIARRTGKSVQDVILEAEHQPLAARAANAAEARQLHDWLLATHRLAA
ncbi:MAG: hypothetical protein Q8L56_07685 [Rhodocyclaceae bacterium]|nr:hypothetical protein [Rhodocyclaceae bacterium]